LTLGDSGAPLAHHRFHIPLCLLQLGDALLKYVELFLKHPENAPAWGSATIPDAKDLSEFGQCKSELQGMAHGLYAFKAFRRI